MTARRWSALLCFAVLGLQWLWHAGLAPPERWPGWALALLFSLPILPSIVLWLARHRQAAFWGAFVALGYFSHGVMEAWANPAARWLGVLEALLSAALVVAASWGGMRARFAKPRI